MERAFVGHPAVSVTVRLAVVLLAAFLVLQCSSGHDWQDVDWHFVIPDGYTGFLVIQYECAGGAPLLAQGKTIQVAFRDDGTFCASDSPFAWRGQIAVETRGGQAVPQPPLWEGQGYGFSGGDLLTLHSPTRQQFEIYWVGDIAYLATIRNQPAYAEQLETFLTDRFGVVFPE